jgi:glyoxylase-like metal-dependent hydrolase (beta-lactamase superfamily II)
MIAVVRRSGMARELADGVWLLDVGLVPPLATNAFLLDDRQAPGSVSTSDDGPVTLVDTGLWRNRPTLVGELAAAGYVPTDIDRVCMTHYDLDHVTGLERLLAAGFDGPVYMGRRDVELVRGEWDPPLVHHKGAFHRLARRLYDFGDADLRPVDDGDRIGGLRAFHTPGHNHGHVVYLHEGLSTACLGDLVWEEDGRLTPPFWLDSYEMRALREPIRQFASEAPDFEVAAMAHGTPFVEGGFEAIQRLCTRF